MEDKTDTFTSFCKYGLVHGTLIHSVYGFPVKFPSSSATSGPAGEADEKPLALGELAQLTVSNEPEAYDVAGASKESFRKTWNPKYTLRSHFDGVRMQLLSYLCQAYFIPFELMSAICDALEDPF